MKLIFFLLVLLKNGTNPTEGLHVIYLSGQIILKYSFNSYYNSFEKVCCKFFPWNCFVNSRGQVDPLYERRIYIRNYIGEFEVRITNLTVMDAGIYRCGVRIFPSTFEDVEVTVSDLSGVNTTLLSAKSTVKPAVWMPSSPSTAIVSENDAEKLGWRTSFMLGAVLSLVVFAAVSVTLVFLHKTEKKKSTDKYRTCSSLDTILEVTYVLQNNPTDGQILEYLKSRHNEITEWNCFVNSRGQVDPLYEGRIYIRNYIGEFEVRITDLTVRDAGKYRCGVRIFPSTFEDVEVTVSDIKDLNGVNTTPLSAKSTNKPAVWWSSSPSTAIVSENDAQKLSDDWRTSYTLAAVLTVLVFAVISMTLLVCRLKTKKKKSTEKSGTCDSANTTLEQNGIIYSMVDFTPHQDPSELYANLQIHSPENTDTSSRCIFTTEESVEYSTILRAPV